jgi:hypothetical protein
VIHLLVFECIYASSQLPVQIRLVSFWAASSRLRGKWSKI